MFSCHGSEAGDERSSFSTLGKSLHKETNQGVNRGRGRVRKPTQRYSPEPNKPRSRSRSRSRSRGRRRNTTRVPTPVRGELNNDREEGELDENEVLELSAEGIDDEFLDETDSQIEALLGDQATAELKEKLGNVFRKRVQTAMTEQKDGSHGVTSESGCSKGKGKTNPPWGEAQGSAGT